MKISILTLFPEMFNGPFDYSIIKRARDKKIVDIELINLRNFGIGKHKIVDDKPYGGGSGMILKIDVLDKAIKFIKNKNKTIKHKVILLSAQGKTFNQKIAKDYSKLDHVILISGHYEDYDARIKKFIDEEVSIGDFILTGGELPAMIIADCIVRLLPEVLKEGVTDNESFSKYLEFPQYTRPEVYKNLKVPEILKSGNHKEIKNWRLEKSIELTKKIRPDLIKKKDL